MNDRPLLSVVIPCHQAAHVLPIQLAALASQIDPPAFEVVVVDNRSSDGIAEVVDRHRPALLAAGALNVRLIEASEEAGASYARNVGASHARAPRLVFCDADDCVSAWWLADAQQLFASAPVFSGSAIPVSDENFSAGIDALRDRVEPEGRAEPELRPQAPLAIPILMGGDFGIERDLFFALGGFDQSLPTAGEDNDLAVRIRAAGYPVLESPAMRIAYRMRTEIDSAAHIARRAARTHVLLCVRYGMTERSPFIGRGRLVSATARLAAAALLMSLRPARRDIAGLRGRAASVRGFWEGTIRYRLMRRVPEPRLGVGLSHPFSRRS